MTSRTNWFNEHPKFKEILSHGFDNYNPFSSRTAMLVYLELCESKHWFEVGIHPCNELKRVYITGRPRRKANKEVVVPLSVDTVLSVEDLRTLDGHKDHKTITLQEITAIQKDLLSNILEEIEKIRCNAKEKKQQEEIALKIKSGGEKAKEQVQNATKKLVKILLDQEKQLLNEIQRSVTKADRNLRVIRHIPATQEYIRNILEKGLVSEMVDIQQEDSSNNCTYNPFKRESSELVFDPNKELSEQVNAGLGKVRLQSCNSDPMLSTIQVDGHLEALKKAKLTVETKTSAGELNNEPSDDVDVQIRPEDDVKVEGRKMRSGA
ncbi:hypothetical protein QZH41_020288, partial [Actinostola sp. cb2023]